MELESEQHADLSTRSTQLPSVLYTGADGLVITTYDPAHRADFKRLNLAWLNRYFKVEPIDEQVLGDPQQQILSAGGEVLFARLGALIVGTVALKRDGPGQFELTKMAVDEVHQGRGYGKCLLQSACALAKVRGAQRVVLYSQRQLRAAISMYRNHGFVELPLTDRRYARCDIKMERLL